MSLVLISAFTVLAFSAPASEPEPPSWVGEVTHTWTPMLGGGVWYQEQSVVTNVAPVLAEYPQPALVGLRGDCREQGYRFDLNTWNTNDPIFATTNAPYYVFPDQSSQEFVITNFQAAANVRFTWSMPVPNQQMLTSYPYTSNYYHSSTNVNDRDANVGGYAYTWQTPGFYAAYLQYLIEPTNMTTGGLLTSYDFTTNSEKVLHTNWGNLRARRGHVAPYTNLVAVILGVEPYTSAQENYVDTNSNPLGGPYGTNVDLFRDAIRGRATSTSDPMYKIPLGFCMVGNHPLDDPSGTWFNPLMNAVTHGGFMSNLLDFSYIDSNHAYWSGDATDLLNRIFPILVNTNGFQYYWTGAPAKSNCLADFTREMWWYDDIRPALTNYGETNFARWNVGCAEHGLSVESRFTANDMGAGLHWGLWLTELMMRNADWDENWVLCEAGNAHAQLQWYDGILTRTPAFYVYKMAQEYYGYQYLTNTLTDGLFSPTSSGPVITNEGPTFVTTPDAVVRVFKDTNYGDYHLFVVNKNTGTNAAVTGWTNWIVSNWEEISGSNYLEQNAISNYDHPIATYTNVHATAASLDVDPISVNHVVLSSNLINIQFGSPSIRPQGMAALGYDSADYWNILKSPSFSVSCLNFQTNNIGSFSATLFSSGGDLGDYSGPDGSVLPFATGILTTDDESFLIELTMPKGTYDVYLYSAAPTGNGYEPESFTYNGVEKSVATNNYTLDTYVEGNQYVVFRDITLTRSSTLDFKVQSTVSAPYANGVQILVH